MNTEAIALLDTERARWEANARYNTAQADKHQALADKHRKDGKDAQERANALRRARNLL